MSGRLLFLLAMLLLCVAATVVTIITYRYPVDPQREQSYAEWLAHWKTGSRDMVRKGQYPEAERTIRSYLRYMPDDLAMRRLLGKTLYENGRYGEASDVFYSILLNCPEDCIARNNLGVSLVRMRQPAAAERELKEAFELSGGDAFIGFNLSRVYSLLGNDAEAQRMLQLVVGALRRENGGAVPDDAVLMDGFIGR